MDGLGNSGAKLGHISPLTAIRALMSCAAIFAYLGCVGSRYEHSVMDCCSSFYPKESRLTRMPRYDYPHC